MAEETGKPTPATDPKTEGKPADKAGAVKPPVLEGKARPASSAKSSDSAGSGSSARTTTTNSGSAPDKAPPSSASGTARSAPWMAGLFGGVVGLGAAYGLALFGLWPVPPQAPPPADPRLAQFSSAIPELQTVTGTVQDELATLTGRVGTLETSLSESSQISDSADPAMSEQLAALSARLDALANAPADPVASDDRLAALAAEVAALQADMASTRTQMVETKDQIATLAQASSESAGADAATIRLPLIFSSLESAFGTGRPFETELASLRQALPETIVPEAVAGRAASGLPRPEVVASQLRAALPDMLAGRPASADATWQDATADWFRGLVAMRPTGPVEGSGPDATIARLEAAVERRDFAAASEQLQALPAAMQRAATPFAADMESLAAAQIFLDQLRAKVLTRESGA